MEEVDLNFVMASRIAARLAEPCSTNKVASNQVDLLLVQNSTDCKQQVLQDSAFLGTCVVDVERHHGKIRLAITA